jgi:hypothetical protein
MESVLNFCVKSVREWKIEGCFKFVENAMGIVIGRGGWVSSFLEIICECKHWGRESSKKGMGMEKKSVGEGAWGGGRWEMGDGIWEMGEGKRSEGRTKEGEGKRREGRAEF